MKLLALLALLSSFAAPASASAVRSSSARTLRVLISRPVARALAEERACCSERP